MLPRSAFWVNNIIFFVGVHCIAINQPDIHAVNEVNVNKTQNVSDVAPGKFISRGQTAQIGQFPWIALLKINNRQTNSTHMCGGTLISKRHILTAAHCVEHSTHKDVEIYLGEYDMDSYPMDCVQGKCTKNVIVYPDKVMSHTAYNRESLDSDIAVLRLTKEAPVGGAIQALPLPPFDIDKPEYDGVPLLVTGWGDTETGDTTILRTAEISLIPYQRCFMMDSRLKEGHLCAGDPSGRDTCPGDSGGPLMMVFKKKYYLSGIVSYGYEECGEAEVGYYTNVYKFMKWIKDQMKV